MNEKASQDREVAMVLQQPDSWYERLRKLEEMLEKIKAKVEVRQSLVVVGKHGQGKSTLIRNWLGPGISPKNNRDDSLPLRTGVDETTSAFVRLTTLAEYGTDALEVRLLPKTALSYVHQRPERPNLPNQSDRLFLSLESADSILSPFAVTRFPVEKEDAKLFLAKRGDRYEPSRQGQVSLTSVQYHSAEIVWPLRLEELKGRTHHLLRVLDTVDAPGADPSGKGAFSDWMRYKSQEVFRTGSQRIDLMVLVSSIEVAAIHVGAQMQEEILRPWRERCGGRTQGRLLIVITHAADLLHDVAGSKPVSSLEQRSPARRLMGNLLEPLDNLGFLDRDGDPDDWPPFFFVENDRQQLSYFQNGLAPDPDRQERLLQLLDQPQQWDHLALGEQCILRLAADWQQEYPHWPEDKIKRIQR